jgi:DsbC/DsbD-like thiol-disulfide interchange protein
MSGRFLWGIVWAITCLSGCSDYSSKQQSLQPGSHSAQDDTIQPTSLESNPIVQSTGAKAVEPVQAKIRLSRNAIASEDSLQLFIDLRITPSWHIYAVDGDSGPYSPTAFELELPSGVEMAGEWTYPDTQTYVGSGILAQVYEGNVSFRADLKLRKSISVENQTIRCRIEYQACNHSVACR